MLWSLNRLSKFRLPTKGKDIGKSKDWYFDEERWRIWWLAARIGNWLVHRRVFISPTALRSVDPSAATLHVDFDQEEIEAEPQIKPRISVLTGASERRSKLYETDSHNCATTGAAISTPLARGKQGHPQEPASALLWSYPGVRGYHVRSRGEYLGTVEDLLADDTQWLIEYVVVDIGTSWQRKLLLIAPNWIEHLSHKESLMRLAVAGRCVRDAPEFDPSRLETDGWEYEEELFEMYYAQF